jgi:hypothetical protein
MTWKKLGIVALIVFLAFVFPVTRRAVLFILPLGKGVDDMIVLVAGVVALAIFGGRWARELVADTRRHLDAMEYNRRTRVLFFAIVGVALLIIAVATWIMLSTVMIMNGGKP